MTLAVEAVFEDGVLKPVNPLALAEHQLVHLIVQTVGPAQRSGAPRWHWQESQGIQDGFAGTVADEVVRQRREG